MRQILASRVVDATRDGNWVMPPARSQDIQALLIALTDTAVPASACGRDKFLWRNASGTFAPVFSSKDTWEQLRLRSPIVPWTDVVWFKEYVPRFSLITWMAMLSRLPTKDRLRGWGMATPASCVLCSVGIETHEHLFFECSYATGIWDFFAAKFIPNPPSTLAAAATWIKNLRQPRSHTTTILKLLLQSVVYHVWKERNSRIFTAAITPLAVLRHSIDRSLRNRLLSFPASDLLTASLLQVYFSRISYPL